MPERPLPRGIVGYLIKVSESLPEPLPAPDRARGSGSGRPPYLTARGLFDRDREPNPNAQELGRRFMAYWTATAPVEFLEQANREERKGMDKNARLADAIFGMRPDHVEEWSRGWEDQMKQIMAESPLSEPAKLFLGTIFSDMVIGGRASVEAVNFEKLGIDPTLMFTGIPDDTRAVDQALYEFHGRVLEAAEKEIARPSESTPQEGQVDSYWTIDPEFIEEQKQLHQEWGEILAA